MVNPLFRNFDQAIFNGFLYVYQAGLTGLTGLTVDPLDPRSQGWDFPMKRTWETVRPCVMPPSTVWPLGQELQLWDVCGGTGAKGREWMGIRGESGRNGMISPFLIIKLGMVEWDQDFFVRN